MCRPPQGYCLFLRSRHTVRRSLTQFIKTWDMYGDFLHWLGLRSTYNLRTRSSHTPPMLFKYLYHGWGSNDISSLRKLSTQLDMLIEKPQFKGKVHNGADGGTMHEDWLRSVSLPGYTLMASLFFYLPSLLSPGLSPRGPKQSGWCRGGGYFELI